MLRFQPEGGSFLPACVTDCYPGTAGDFAAVSKGGIYSAGQPQAKNKLMDVDAGCNGSVAGELGGAALAQSGWKVVFNAHRDPMTLGQPSYDATR